MALASLPIDSVLPELLDTLAVHGAVVLEAPTGSGKTTRVPPALLSLVAGEIWVLEPRRVAARAAATRVAEERGEALGHQVGFAMRLDRRGGPETRLWYVTEALLTRRLDNLAGIDAVVLDEFHERSIHGDLALAWVKALRRERPMLKLVVMSATLDAESVANFLGCPRVRATGSLFPVAVRYLDRKDERPIEHRVAAGIRSVEGDVLAFLPGIGEIERTAELLSDYDVYPLHGELDGAQQDRALRAATGSRRRVVLATNVAETSVTVDGIHAVVDAGLARQAAYDPWTGLPTLDLVPIARDAATQRAGRAGRVMPGVCLRLYSKADFDARPAHTLPEVRRIDLSATALALGGREIEWFEAPPAAAWQSAVQLLERLGAVANGERTEVGNLMHSLPLAPRLARVLVEGERRGVLGQAAALVTLLSARKAKKDHTRDPVEEALDGGGDPRERKHLVGLMRGLLGGRAGRELPSQLPEAHSALVQSLFAGFPDRVGRREGGRIRLADGGAAECAVGRDAFVLVSEVDKVGTRVRARSVTPIDENWLLESAEVRATLRWTGTRVECVEELCFGALVLESGPSPGDPAAVAALLYAHAQSVMHRHVPDWDAGLALIHRAAFLRRVGVPLPELELSVLKAKLCEDCRSLADLESASLASVVEQALGEAPLVRRLAPEFVELPGRSRAPVDYSGEEPFVSSRMQDFFGMRDGPRIANDYPLVLHLLAPNYRPVQVTRDLSGFWIRLYPAVRKELSRRYPRHHWPEDPRA